MNITDDALYARAEALWTTKRDCTCGATDIDVGIIRHAPGCGDPRPDDVAALLIEVARDALIEGVRLGIEAGAGVCDMREDIARTNDYQSVEIEARWCAKSIRSIDAVAVVKRAP